MRQYLRSLLRSEPTIDELLDRARAELAINPTIRTYDCKTNPLMRMRTILERMIKTLQEVGVWDLLPDDPFDPTDWFGADCIDMSQ